MEELKMMVGKMSRRQRIEYIVLLTLSVLAVVAFCFIVYSTRRTIYNTGTIENLQKQNEQLAKNNELLIKTVQDLNVTVTSREGRDSVAQANIAKTASVLPQLSAKIDQIDKTYEKNVNAVRSFTDADIERYISAEADRIRKEGQ